MTTTSGDWPNPNPGGTSEPTPEEIAAQELWVFEQEQLDLRRNIRSCNRRIEQLDAVMAGAQNDRTAEGERRRQFEERMAVVESEIAARKSGESTDTTATTDAPTTNPTANGNGESTDDRIPDTGDGDGEEITPSDGDDEGNEGDENAGDDPA